MSRGGVGSHDALALALAFFEAPGRFPDLLHGRAPLPSGMTELLQVAAGDLPEGAPPPLFVSLPELRKAALFFIEQVLLARGADHYRVMGLVPGAGAGQIKEHHRLLMRLFHPDRRSTPDEQAEEVAARINRAYAVLRGADSRAAYFETMQPPTSATSSTVAYPRPVVLAVRQPGRSLPPGLRRHAPQIVLGAVALVAIAAVATVYVNRVPEGAIGAGALAGAPRRAAVAEPSEIVAPRSDGAAPVDKAVRTDLAGPIDVSPPAAGLAQAAPLVESRSRPADVVPPARTTATPAVVDAAAPVGAAKVPSTVVPVPTAVASAPPAPVWAATSSEPSAPVNSLSTSAAQSGERVRAASTQEVAGTVASIPMPAPAVEASAPQVSEPARAEPAREAPAEQPTAVLARFVAAYERGDLEALMSLFDQDARIERGGRARIRSDYDALFRGSEMRSLRLRDLRWSGDGDMVRAEGAFVARVLRRGEGDLRDVAGSIRVELVRRGDRLLIIGLYHTVG